jgi:hypothetical protein
MVISSSSFGNGNLFQLLEVVTFSSSFDFQLLPAHLTSSSFQLTELAAFSSSYGFQLLPAHTYGRNFHGNFHGKLFQFLEELVKIGKARPALEIFGKPHTYVDCDLLVKIGKPRTCVYWQKLETGLIGAAGIFW